MSTVFYIVATPIGNLEDMSNRAIRILSEVETILCEDTRVTKKILNHYGISSHTESYHAQASQSKEDSIIKRIGEGHSFALVSDAGTPTISDPGVKLIKEIRLQIPDVKIISIPGASALITALSVTGFSGNQFTFYGFLPHKKGRSKIFDEIESSSRVAIFYESPHRLLKTLEELSLRMPERQVSVGRELTKLFEETPVCSSLEMFNYFKDNPDKIRGECVITINR